MEIKIDVTDWNEDYQSKELDVSSENEIIKRAKEGVKPSEMGRHIVVAREKGLAPDNIIKPNKSILNIGAAYLVSQLQTKFLKKKNLKNGKNITVRALTCPTEGVQNQAVVDSDTEDGCQNAINYLLNVIPGHIQGRLVIIAANGGDVEDYAEKLIMEIRNIVSELI